MHYESFHEPARHVQTLGEVIKNGRPGIGIRFVEAAKSCCYETAVHWPVNMAGQRLTCAKCNNLLKSIESFDTPLTPDVDPTGLPLWKVAEGFAHLAVIYRKNRFHLNKVELDLEAQGLRADAITDTASIWIAVQNPAKWFELDQEMVLVKMDDGCDSLMGRIQSKFVGKSAPTAWLTNMFEADETNFERAG